MAARPPTVDEPPTPGPTVDGTPPPGPSVDAPPSDADGDGDAAPVLSVCVVGTDGAATLPACLDAVAREAATVGGPVEVLVLDNASTDDSVRVARAHPVGATVIALARRRGKAENDTLLLRRARAPHALLLNEDSEPCRGAVAALMAALDADPDAACAGAALLRPDDAGDPCANGTPQPSAWRFPTVRTTLAQALLLHRRHVVASGGGPTDPPRRVDWCQSACLLVDRAASAAVGHLDPVFFVYGDEVDLQRRLADAGRHALHVPAARCVHHEQLSTGAAARPRIVELHRNRDRYLRRHRGPARALACRPLAALPYALRAAAALVLPGHDARRYAWHAQAALRPGRGEGIAERAAAHNARLAGR